MKYTLVFLLTLLSVFCEAQNRGKGSIEYDLGSGGSVVLSQSTFDSLMRLHTESDSSVTATINTAKIFEFYCAKRNSLYVQLKGQPVPDFEAKDTEGFAQRPSMYRGRVLLLHFWSFWSNSFDHEIPELNRLQVLYGKEGLAILSFTGISLGDDEKKKLTENPLKFPLIDNAYLFADDFFKTKLMRPCIVIIDKNGIMSFFYEGSMLPESKQNPKASQSFDFEDKIKALLK